MESLEKERTAKENRDLGRENREIKEDDKMDKELRVAAALERADYLAREVKTSRNQMQNIMLHMQQVLAAIKKLRAELDLPSSEDASSVEEDARRVVRLKTQIQEYRTELEAMREDLINEQTQEIQKQHPNLLLIDAAVLATKKVAELYTKLEE